MQHLQHLLEYRAKNFLTLQGLSESFSKKTDSSAKFTSQSRRFTEAKETLMLEIINCDQLFQKWASHMLNNFQPFSKYFGVLQKQFEYLYGTSEKYRPSLISYTEDIKQILASNQIVCLNQKTGRSELFQLVVGLLIEYYLDKSNTKIILYTSQQVQSEYEYFYLNYQAPNTVDIENDYREELLKEIPNLQIRYFEDRTAPKEKDSDSMVIFDLFTCSKSLYGPQFELVMSKKWFKNVLIYTQNEQQMMYDELVELNNKFPCEVVKDVKLKQLIFKILEQSKLYAEKVDIIIFSPHPEREKLQIEDLLKNSKHIPALITGLEPYNPNTNNIFIATNQRQLASWRYSFDHVIAVCDYGMHSKIRFSTDEKIYVQMFQEINQKEMEVRIAFLGRLKPGKYFQMFNWRPKQPKLFHKQDLSLYVLSMLSLGYSIEQILKDKQPQAKTRLQKAINLLKNLKIIEVNGTKGTVLDKSIHSYNISPFFAKMLLELKGKWGQANILAYLIASLITPGSLKRTQNKNAHNIWKKPGDLSIYAEILYIYQLQTERAKKGQGNQIPVHKSSVNEDEFTMFGNLYHEYKPKPKLLLSQMPLQALRTELDIEVHFINKCLENVRKIRNSFKLKFIEYQNIDEEIPQVLEIILKTFDNAAVYTGSRRFGYKMKSGRNFLPSKESLLSVFNQRPNIVLPLKLIQRPGRQPEVLLSSKIAQEDYLSIIGEIPICNQKSSFSDTEVEFAGVSNAMFEALWSGSFIQEFENKYGCMVEPNREIASIIIFCSKQTKEVINNEFKQFLEKTRNQLEVETKIVDYNVWKLVFQKGGSIRQFLNKNDSRVISLVNIPKQSTDQEIRQLIEEYADIEKVDIKENPANKTKTAVITFCSTGDLRWAVDQLHYTSFNGKRIKFEKLENNPEDKKISSDNTVKFKWYAWPLTKKGIGIVVFRTHEAASKAAEVFARPFDGKQVQATVQQNKLHLSGLNEQTDQIYMRTRLAVYGQIQDVQLEKLPVQEVSNAQNLIQYFIKEFTNKNERFHIVYVNKMSNGLRVAKVEMYNVKSIPVLCNALNEGTSLMGKTRLYVHPHHTHPILIADEKMEGLYQNLLSESIEQLGIAKSSISIRKQQFEKLHYIILKSSNLDALTLVINKFNQKLKQQAIQMTPNNKQVYLSDMGRQLLNRVQQQYGCKFVINYLKKQVGVIAKPGDYESIVGQLIVIPTTVIEDIVTCSLKTYRHLCKNAQKLEQIKSSNCLEEIKIDHIGKSIFMKGLPYHLKNARQALLFHIESIHTQNHDGVSAEMCGICCEYLARPYRLQICGHSFCEECLMFSINNAFGDVSCFPLKCPHCLSQIAIQDLGVLLDATGWNKLTGIAVNDYVNKHGDQYGFCFTANCKGVYLTKQSSYQCPVCLKSYCALCKMDNHPGLSCQEAKDGTAFLLKKYMQENDVRICPNPSCKMLMQRVDGCYRVTCSRCNQSICFKCPRDSMAIFPSADECYKHLTDKHGGYW